MDDDGKISPNEVWLLLIPLISYFLEYLIITYSRVNFKMVKIIFVISKNHSIIKRFYTYIIELSSQKSFSNAYTSFRSLDW